jgi:hypothetical protein
MTHARPWPKIESLARSDDRAINIPRLRFGDMHENRLSRWRNDSYAGIG